MKAPNASEYDASPEYLRELLARAGLSQERAANQLGIAARTMRSYLDDKDARTAPYSLQYCLEVLAELASDDVKPSKSGG